MIFIIKLKISKEKKKTKILSIILLFSFLTIVKQVSSKPEEHILWIFLLTLLLLINKTFSKFIIIKSRLIYIGKIIIILCITYFAIGAALVNYDNESILLDKNGVELNYSLNYRNRISMPITSIKVFLIGGKGFELTYISADEIEHNKIRTNMSFLANENTLRLPTKMVIIQEIFGVVPIISIRNNHHFIKINDENHPHLYLDHLNLNN